MSNPSSNALPSRNGPIAGQFGRAAIAVGTMLARPPAAAVTVAYGGSSYWYHGGAYYTRVISGGATRYQVVAPPAGIVIVDAPGRLQFGARRRRCLQSMWGTHYQRVSGGYRVVVF